MKKILIRLVLVLLLLCVLAVLAVHFFLDSTVKKGIETVGPRLTKVDVKLDSISISLLSGSGKVKNFVLGNPEGYKSASSIQVGLASLSLEPRSLMSDKIVIRSINVQGPEITFETDLKGNNLKKLLSNLEETTGGGGNQNAPAQPADAKAGKKLEVDDFIISGAKVHVTVNSPLGAQSATVPLTEIHLTDLGKDANGITPAELAKRVLTVIVQKAEEQASTVLADMAKGAQFMSKDVSTNAINKVTKGLGDLFQKK